MSFYAKTIKNMSIDLVNNAVLLTYSKSFLYFVSKLWIWEFHLKSGWSNLTLDDALTLPAKQFCIIFYITMSWYLSFAYSRLSVILRNTYFKEKLSGAATESRIGDTTNNTTEVARNMQFALMCNPNKLYASGGYISYRRLTPKALTTGTYYLLTGTNHYYSKLLENIN